MATTATRHIEPLLPSPDRSVAPSAATATGAAYVASESVAVNAGHASATGAAGDATISIETFVQAMAELASATGAAGSAAASIAVNGGHSSGSGAAYDPLGSASGEGTDLPVLFPGFIHV